MSALWAPGQDLPEEADVTGSRSRGPKPLRPVGPPAPRLARLPFLAVLIGIFGFGMVGLLMLNTTLQNQAFSARALNREATELAYAQGDLENQLAVAAAPQELARRASEIGMRPNPYPAFLVMPGGKAAGARVVGPASPVTGNEAPVLVVKTPAEIAAARAAHRARVLEKAKAKAAKEKAEAAEAKAKAKAKATAKAEGAKQKAKDQAAAKKAAAKKKGR